MLWDVHVWLRNDENTKAYFWYIIAHFRCIKMLTVYTLSYLSDPFMAVWDFTRNGFRNILLFIMYHIYLDSTGII